MKKMKQGFFFVSYMATFNKGVSTLWGDTTFTVEADVEPSKFLKEIRKQIEETLEQKLDNRPTIVNIVRLY
jgi:hypothetical protein